MRKVINRYTIGGTIGAILAFLYKLISDGELASERAHRGRSYSPSPSIWVAWSARGAVAGVLAALLPTLSRLGFRHPRIAAVFLGWILLERRTGLSAAMGGRPDLDIHRRPEGWGR